MPSPPPGLRFYGVIDADSASAGPPFDEPGIHAVAFRDLAAVVAPAPYTRARPGEAELADFVRIVDALAKRGPVLPAPPGTVFRNARVLEHWMEIHYAKLHEALGVVEQRADKSAPYEYVRMELGA